MSMEVPMSGRVPGIVGEVGSARQLPDRNTQRQSKKRSTSSNDAEQSLAADASDSPNDQQTKDSLEITATETGIESADNGSDEELSLASANGLTLDDVRAAYNSN